MSIIRKINPEVLKATHGFEALRGPERSVFVFTKTEREAKNVMQLLLKLNWDKPMIDNLGVTENWDKSGFIIQFNECFKSEEDICYGQNC